MLDLRSILIYPSIYKLLQNLVRNKKHTQEYVDKYVKPVEGGAILDIGCGPADILDFLPQIRYYGFDLSPKYINEAKIKYGDRGEFFCQELSETSIPNIGFDIVLANNVLHHLNDGEAIDLFKLAKKCLKLGGRLVTCDGCRSVDEGLISKVVLSLDRGKHVRDKESYLNLARQAFNNVAHETRNDLAHIPVNGIFITCVKE
ncbi:MAG: class I SAM-dependent methyltransferase [Patescibacteria group bacterium]